MLVRSLVVTAFLAMASVADASTWTFTSGNNFGAYVDSDDGDATLMMFCTPVSARVEPVQEPSRTRTLERLDFRVNSDATFGEGRKGRSYFEISGSGLPYGRKVGDFDWSSSSKRSHKELGLDFVRKIEVDAMSVWRAIEANDRVSVKIDLVDFSIEEQSERLRSIRFQFDLRDFNKKIIEVREQCLSSDDAIGSPLPDS